MRRRRIDADECAARKAAHAADADAHPLTATEVKHWLLGLGGLGDFHGKVDVLAACEDMLKYACEDEMLASDRSLIVAAIAQLHKDLDAIPDHLRVRRRVDYCRTVAALGFNDVGDPFSD